MHPRPYIIWLPGLSKSNGVKILLLLADFLKERGETVYVYLKRKSENTGAIKHEILTTIPRNLIDNAIVVYPEVAAGNPLRIRNVARYILYYPGGNGGNRQFHHSELLFTFDEAFAPSASKLTVPWLDAKLFYNDGKPKTVDCSFIHKGGKWRNAPETIGTTEITMEFPRSHEELAQLLRKTRVLYSYDACSSVLDEAFLCGAQVKIITEAGTRDYDFTYEKRTRDFTAELDRFITETQALDYRGKLQSRLQIKAWINSIWVFLIKPMLVRIKASFGK